MLPKKKDKGDAMKDLGGSSETFVAGLKELEYLKELE